MERVETLFPKTNVCDLSASKMNDPLNTFNLFPQPDLEHNCLPYLGHDNYRKYK